MPVVTGTAQAAAISSQSCSLHAPHFTETDTVMALTAILSKAAVMLVILVMTTFAIAGSLPGAVAFGAVTHVASQTLMGVLQYELRLGIVIEGPEAPTIGVVAGTTLITQAALVNITLAVTIQTARCGVMEALVQVTGFTWSDRVVPNQGEAG